MKPDLSVSPEEFLERQRQGLKASVEYFGASNKPGRERWVCREFLKTLGTRFKLEEIASPAEEPPDVSFRSAAFEIKEVVDPGRKRHSEYKTAYERALNASDPNELLSQYQPKDINPVGVLERVTTVVEKYSTRYAPAVRSSLDLLVYVNLIEHTMKPDAMPSCSHLASYGWRSVSALFGSDALVFYAGKGAPRFIKLKAGTRTQRSAK